MCTRPEWRSRDQKGKVGEASNGLCPPRCIVQPSRTSSSSVLSSQQVLGSQPRTPTSLTPLSLHAAPHITSSPHGTFLNFCTISASLRNQSPHPHLPLAELWFTLPKQRFSCCVTITVSPLQPRASHQDTHGLQRHRAQQPRGIGAQMLTSVRPSLTLT